LRAMAMARTRRPIAGRGTNFLPANILSLLSGRFMNGWKWQQQA
jgi:hypothetical protein